MNKAIKGKTLQQLIGIKDFTHEGVDTVHGSLVYFIIAPTNISVLSRECVADKIRRFAQIFSGQPDIELLCTDASQNFSENRAFLGERIRKEANPRITALLRAERGFLDEMESRRASSREFMLTLRIRDESESQTFASVSRILRLVGGLGFDARLASRDEIKRLYGRYFATVADGDKIGDFEGEVGKWSCGV